MRCSPAAASGGIELSLSAEEWEAIWLTLIVSARAVAFGLPVAILVAWVLVRYRFPGHALFNAIVDHFHVMTSSVRTHVGHAIATLIGFCTDSFEKW